MANDMLKSIGNERKRENGDDLHRAIKLVRYIAENCANQGILNLPLVFTIEPNHDLEKCNSAAFSDPLDNSLYMRATTSHRRRDFLSVAQRNAYLYYDCRFPNKSSEGNYLNVSKSRHMYEDSDSRKISSSTSTSGINLRSSFNGANRASGGGRKLSNLSAARASTYDNAYQQRRRKVTNDLIWERLREAGLGKYVNLLKEEEVDAGMFLTLTSDDLLDIGNDADSSDLLSRRRFITEHTMQLLPENLFGSVETMPETIGAACSNLWLNDSEHLCFVNRPSKQ
ncbi:unnamed protein product [Gongylonema pulchrum]|uniref:SAM domain-containing protein n=1 Tax=Gongylonema pulchrum TaxID=637853 RepID=A0A3P6QCT0_9BILA|nr:unnamed protein product [Gongylonema pulchrum]